MSPDTHLDVPAYAEIATARLLATLGATTVDWRNIIERGMAAAYEQSSAASLTSMVQVVAHMLDAQGRFEDAVGEIDHALVFAREAPDASIVLLGLKAAMLSATGRFAEARQALALGGTQLGGVEFGNAVRFRIFRAIVLWQEFEDHPRETQELLQLTSEPEHRRDRGFLLAWYVPFLAATGTRRTAHPWIRALRLDAEAGASRWRLSDASSFEAWDNFLRPPDSRRGFAPLDQANAMSVWRGEAIKLRDAVLRGDGRDADAALDALRRARRRVGSAAVGAVEQFGRPREALDGLGDAIDATPPASTNLNNLGAWLAEAEAIALRGTQRAAHAWLEPLSTVVPSGVVSALEWPVSVSRIRGLLAARAGLTRRARTEFQQAADWSVAAGNAPEEALSLLQLGELCAAADLRVAERTWTTQRREGATRLRALGYDPVPHAYAIAHGLTLSMRNRLAERLTPREVEVLSCLSQGMSYREAALALSIAPPTVQTLVHRAYEKLGVSGRMAAVAEARRLGVL
jgi:DNA-binding CsgD family transcriptional regulator